MAYVCILLVFFGKFDASLPFLDSVSSCNVRGSWSFVTFSNINSSPVSDFGIINGSWLQYFCSLLNLAPLSRFMIRSLLAMFEGYGVS